MWHRIIDDKQIPVRFETAAARILTNESGRVIGVVVQSPEGFGEIHCKGLVLGSGGFSANPALRAQFLGSGWDLAKVRGTKYNTCDGIQMALDIGGETFGHWSVGRAAALEREWGDCGGG